MNINTLELNSGEFVGIGAIEVTSIPALSIVKDNYPQGADIENEYRQGFTNLLTELYQNHRTFSSHNENAETSFELLWLTEPVENQPFKAKINLYMILRSIARDENTAILMVERLLSSCTSMLKMYQYGTRQKAGSVIH